LKNRRALAPEVRPFLPPPSFSPASPAHAVISAKLLRAARSLYGS
jgi:hypothetical protein